MWLCFLFLTQPLSLLMSFILPARQNGMKIIYETIHCGRGSFTTSLKSLTLCMKMRLKKSMPVPFHSSSHSSFFLNPHCCPIKEFESFPLLGLKSLRVNIEIGNKILNNGKSVEKSHWNHLILTILSAFRFLVNFIFISIFNSKRPCSRWMGNNPQPEVNSPIGCHLKNVFLWVNFNFSVKMREKRCKFMRNLKVSFSLLYRHILWVVRVHLFTYCVA